jgi:hypothetical protein
LDDDYPPERPPSDVARRALILHGLTQAKVIPPGSIAIVATALTSKKAGVVLAALNCLSAVTPAQRAALRDLGHLKVLAEGRFSVMDGRMPALPNVVWEIQAGAQELLEGWDKPSPITLRTYQPPASFDGR